MTHHPDPVLPVSLSPAPLIVVVSGPSGVGKTEICRRLLAADPRFVRTITATTRAPRGAEKDTVDYFFRTRDQFERERTAGRFLESAVVHGEYYGTPRTQVEEHLAAGRSPLLNVDVQGGASVKSIRPEAVLVFFVPPSWEELETRLRRRGTESEEAIRTRLANARVEVREWTRYDYVVVNDVLETAVAETLGILAAERARTARLVP